MTITLELLSRRVWKAATSSLSVLEVGGVPECFVLEDRVRPDGAPKVPGETAIPAGRYRIDMKTISPKFGVILPRLVGVPGFSGILIHSGTNEHDTLGCLIVGRVAFAPTAERIAMVTESRLAAAALKTKLEAADAAGWEIWITIV